MLLIFLGEVSCPLVALFIDNSSLIELKKLYDQSHLEFYQVVVRLQSYIVFFNLSSIWHSILLFGIFHILVMNFGLTFNFVQVDIFFLTKWVVTQSQISKLVQFEIHGMIERYSSWKEFWYILSTFLGNGWRNCVVFSCKEILNCRKNLNLLLFPWLKLFVATTDLGISIFMRFSFHENKITQKYSPFGDQYYI